MRYLHHILTFLFVALLICISAWWSADAHTEGETYVRVDRVETIYEGGYEDGFDHGFCFSLAKIQPEYTETRWKFLLDASEGDGHMAVELIAFCQKLMDYDIGED